MSRIQLNEEGLLKLWSGHAVRPTHVKVNPEAVAYLAAHRPHGGNSQQRRKWRRMWTPERKYQLKEIL